MKRTDNKCKVLKRNENVCKTLKTRQGEVLKMQNKKRTKYTLNVDDGIKNNTKNGAKVNKRIIIVGVIVIIAALLVLKLYFLDELKDDKKISSGIEKITGDSDNKAKDNNNSKHNKQKHFKR